MGEMAVDATSCIMHAWIGYYYYIHDDDVKICPLGAAGKHTVWVLSCDIFSFFFAQDKMTETGYYIFIH